MWFNPIWVNNGNVKPTGYCFSRAILIQRRTGRLISCFIIASTRIAFYVGGVLVNNRHSCCVSNSFRKWKGRWVHLRNMTHDIGSSAVTVAGGQAGMWTVRHRVWKIGSQWNSTPNIWGVFCDRTLHNWTVRTLPVCRVLQESWLAYKLSKRMQSWNANLYSKVPSVSKCITV